MIQETFLRLQHSESILCAMASQIFAAYISNGNVDHTNEDEYIDRAANVAIKLASRIDRAVESDDEKGDS